MPLWSGRLRCPVMNSLATHALVRSQTVYSGTCLQNNPKGSIIGGATMDTLGTDCILKWEFSSYFHSVLHQKMYQPTVREDSFPFNIFIITTFSHLFRLHFFNNKKQPFLAFSAIYHTGNAIVLSFKGTELDSLQIIDEFLDTIFKDKRLVRWQCLAC